MPQNCNLRVRAAPASPIPPPLKRILSPQVTARGLARFPAIARWATRAAQTCNGGGISGIESRDLTLLLHKSLRACHSAIFIHMPLRYLRATPLSAQTAECAQGFMQPVGAREGSVRACVTLRANGRARVRDSPPEPPFAAARRFKTAPGPPDSAGPRLAPAASRKRGGSGRHSSESHPASRP